MYGAQEKSQWGIHGHQRTPMECEFSIQSFEVMLIHNRVLLRLAENSLMHDQVADFINQKVARLEIGRGHKKLILL